KLEDQRVAPVELVHLGLQLGRIAVVEAGMRLLGLLPQPRGIGDGAEVAAIRHRVEAHGVEVGDDDLVSRRRESGAGLAGHRGVEARRLVMGVDDEEAHADGLVFASGAGADMAIGSAQGILTSPSHTYQRVTRAAPQKRLPILPAERALKVIAGRWKAVIL